VSRASRLAAVGRRVDRVRDRLPFALALAAVAVAAGGAVLLVAVDVFPYHSVNDDEAVYLTAAAMLLEGRLFLTPSPLPVDAVRPWFFVETAPGRLTPKYTPPTAAVFAVGLAVDRPRLVLGAVGAGVVALVGVLARDAYDRSTGVGAAIAIASAPLYLFTSATFLSYAPTTLANLAFAVAYVRSYRADGRRRRLAWGVVAGVATGWAFFARPYTAVLFASPFVAHTCWRLWRAGRGRGPDRLRPALARALAVALPGLGFVGLTLGYNAVVVGDPFVFPYEAFAPRDGLGFGERAILGYETTYTPALAVASTVGAGSRFVTRWGPAGPLGAALAAVGLLALAADLLGAGDRARSTTGARRRPPRLPDRELRVVVAGLVPAVVVGEAYFWGTYNGISNGLIDLLGPYYHFDLLVPAATFAAAGGVALVRRAGALARDRVSPAEARGLALVALLVTAPGVAGLEATLVDDPLAENRLRTEGLASAYEPFADADFDDAIVLVPTPYGDWSAHPFQALRNDPGFDGDVVYAADGPPARDLRVLAATNRTPYRFSYRGAWTGGVRPVEADLRPLDVRRGERVAATTTLGVPAGARSASIRVETDGTYARYRARPPADDGAGATLPVDWTIGPDGVRVDGYERAVGPARVPLPAGASEVALAVTFVDAGGASVTYRQTVTARSTDGSVAVVWPPETRVCRLQPDCGTEGAWVGPDGDYLAGVSVSTNASVAG
jgi:hypothetical protein